MRFRQDLCIALILTVIGAGGAGPPKSGAEAEDGLAVIDGAMQADGLSDGEMRRVRELIARARDHERAGDEDGALAAIAEASAILRLA